MLRRPGRARRSVIAGVLGMVTAVVAVVWLVPETYRQKRAGAAPLVPAAVHEGPTTVVSFGLLDGRRVQLRYPSQLGIAELGLTLTAEVQWSGRVDGAGCCSARVSASHATVSQAYGATGSLETYPGAGRHSIGLFSAVGRRLPPGFTGGENLVFRFGGWIVEADASAVGADGGPPSMTPGDRSLWAARLGATTGPGGYLMLRPAPPLALAPVTSSNRLTATFGLGSPYEAQRNILDLTDGECGLPGSDTSARNRLESGAGPPGVTWCDPGSGLHVTAVGARPFVDGVANNLVITVPEPDRAVPGHDEQVASVMA